VVGGSGAALVAALGTQYHLKQMVVPRFFLATFLTPTFYIPLFFYEV
jgi:hypothetical protein